MSVTRAGTIVLFVIALSGLVVVEMIARRPTSRIPTLGAVCGYVMGYRLGRVPVGRIGLLGFWWWLGYHFLAR